MNTRMLLALGLATVAAVALALIFVDRSDETRSEGDEQLLLPGLADRVNSIDALDIVGPDGQTVATLRRERERWRMREKHDYEADFARIHDLLRDLARAERLEGKTGKPEWYGRLGVAAPGEGEGSGTAVRFPDAELPVMIVGRTDPAGIGRYVRRGDEPQAWLTDRNLDLPVERMEWLERAIMSIPAADIREVSVRHPDGDEVELRPGDEEGSVWVMLDPPADREVKQAWELQRAANALAALNMEDVRPHESAPVPDDAVETVYRTRDGIIFTARSWSDEEGNWVHFRVSEDESRDSSEDSGTNSPGTGAMDREIDIVAVDGRLAPWQFAVSEERFDLFRPTTEDLLVAPEEASEG
ncbi:DUF4340 domain-containing protein [Wenzhouxiangella sp. EGI_FJ10305]|uniref:DUF4340 domain-containing protein n=1 Tax=Wenzhouxiangella sp. EGI_FJ10305 TaxID=3243768 RepID=UPI0035E2FA03